MKRVPAEVDLARSREGIEIGDHKETKQSRDDTQTKTQMRNMHIVEKKEQSSKGEEARRPSMKKDMQIVERIQTNRTVIRREYNSKIKSCSSRALFCYLLSLSPVSVFLVSGDGGGGGWLFWKWVIINRRFGSLIPTRGSRGTYFSSSNSVFYIPLSSRNLKNRSLSLSLSHCASCVHTRGGSFFFSFSFFKWW